MNDILQEGKKFVRLPQEELGTFYTMDCYVFLCRYEVIPEDNETDLDEEEIELSDEKNGAGDSSDAVQMFKRKVFPILLELISKLMKRIFF